MPLQDAGTARCAPSPLRRALPAWLCAAALLALVVPLVGCTSLRQWVRQGFRVGPDYAPAPAPVAEQWIDYTHSQVNNAPGDYRQWWHVFQDPLLDQLIEQASQQNLTLRTAGMRILEARARLNIARGNLWPQLQQAFGNFQRNNTSQTEANVLLVPDFDHWDVGFNASWELDFWGRFRRAIEAESALLDAAIEDYDNVLVLLQAEVARAYIQYRTFQQRIQVARQNVQLQQRTLQIADVQFRNGKVTELDVAQARENLAATQALVPALESGLRQTANALCVLLGIPPQDLTQLLGEGPIPPAPEQVVVGIPAQLLRRRPDVRRAERLAAAQSAAIGLAEAEFYPHIAINGYLGYGSQKLSDLFRSESFIGAVGPSFQWNILNYGRLLNNVRAQQARFYQRVLEYQQTVLEAAREVEDAIVAFLKEQQRLRRLQESAAQAQRAVQIATIQYRRGTVNFQPVVYMQQILAGRQDQLVQSQGAVALRLVAVYKALGGGWQTRLPRRVAPEAQPLPKAPAQPDPLQTEALAPPPLEEENTHPPVVERIVPHDLGQCL